MAQLIEPIPTVMMGKPPMIRGTRITVESILETLAAGRAMRSRGAPG